MKNRALAFLLTVFMLLSLCACGQTAAPAETAPKEAASADMAAPDSEETSAEAADSEEAAETEAAEAAEIVLTDMIGREVTVTPGSYTRVVCIGAGALRMYSYIGDVSLLCGVEDIDNLSLEERPKMFDSVARPYVLAFGEHFAVLPSCGVGGPQAQTAEAEKILSCNPDIVISEYEDAEKEDALQEQLGVPVITLKAGPGGVFDESFSGSMKMLGQLFGQEEKAEALVSFIETERAEIAKRTADIPDEEKPLVYICGLGNWGTTNHLMTAQNYVPFQVANVKNAVTDLEAPGIQEIEEEKFVAAGEDMDIMIMDAAAVKNIKPLYAEDPAMFDSCRAWRNGEVYLEMAYNAYYTNYEIALINTWFIAKTVYPDRFGDIDMTEKMNEVTRRFLGQELAEQIEAAPSSFGGYQKIDTAAFFE
ncbi:ABC transporter substrate-binding protein [Lachnoclostridium sp. Marseille-P6806]|uniref:ABC transporter substrate-binding protein n=1 Tax=Lachnoclostridium sp. Marseille-P6806 TaxID=2364793 RepID=UPI0010327238|nr:ABC transporter substrate-binding protein [Lachnoclostridium sp. Marseille-P6806]